MVRVRLFVSALLLLLATPSRSVLEILDGPRSLAPLRTGRYAPFQTEAADATRADITARVVLVPQPGAEGPRCPDYDPERVRGALVLELRAQVQRCSVGTRVALAASAGAVGWLHEHSYAWPGSRADLWPGFRAYGLDRGDLARLVGAPPAVDIAQQSASLTYLIDAATAALERGEPAPRATLRVRGGRDPWTTMRASGSFALWRALTTLFALAVVELAVCRIYALTFQTGRNTLPFDLPDGALDARGGGGGGGGGGHRRRLHALGAGGGDDWSSERRGGRPWRIGLLVLLTAGISALLRAIIAAVDPRLSFGRFSFVESRLLEYVPMVLEISAQTLQLCYMHASIALGHNIETLTIYDAPHKALTLALVALTVAALTSLVVLRDALPEGSFLLAFLLASPTLLALASMWLKWRVRRSAARATSAYVEAKLRRLALCNCLLVCTALPQPFLFSPAVQVGLTFFSYNVWSWIAYMQCELIAPLHVRPHRGPLRWALLVLRHRLRLARARWSAVGGLAVHSSGAQSSARTTVGDGPSDDGSVSFAIRRSKAAAAVDPDALAGGAPTLPLVASARATESACKTRSFDGSHLMLGVSLACLRDFARTERASAQHATTAQMGQPVRLLTAASLCSFAEQFEKTSASDGLPAVGRATVFVSHAQACSFAKLLSALEAYAEMHAPPPGSVDYFWLDLMCIRQHEVAADVLRISAVITTIGKVAMVLDPWDKPLCLERVWCLYEIAHSVGEDDDASGRMPGCLELGALGWRRHGTAVAKTTPDAYAPSSPPPWAVADAQRPRVQLFLTMSPIERLKLVHAARTSRAQIARALTRFDCRTAGASIEADRQMILEYIADKFAAAGSDARLRESDADKEAAAQAAYARFNEGVQRVVHDAIAALSHTRSGRSFLDPDE